MKIQKNDIYHYFINLNGEYLYMKIKSIRDYEGEHGIGSSWKVIDQATNSEYFRREYPVGEEYSANQFQGVGLDGLINYIYDSKKEVLKGILE